MSPKGEVIQRGNLLSRSASEKALLTLHQRTYASLVGATFDYPDSSGQPATIVLKSTARWRVLLLPQRISSVLGEGCSFGKPRWFNKFSIREAALSMGIGRDESGWLCL
jgi:hypothetical protein